MLRLGPETCNVPLDDDTKGRDTMGILDQIRNTTVADLDKVTGDFSDLPASTYRPRVERQMIRVVEGATDLRDAHPRAGLPNMSAGMVTVDPELQRRDSRPFKDADDEPMRPAQSGKIWHTMNNLRGLDPVAGAQADEWWARQTNVTKVQASEWITRLKAKIADIEANGATPITDDTPVPVATDPRAVWSEWREVAGKLAAIGGRYGTRFAVGTEKGAVNELAFWWIAPGRDGRFFLRQIIGGQGAVRVRMSPEAMLGVAKKIIAAGPIEAMTRYGLELGECGHCGRELTNDESRAAGIGPKCRKKMGGWHG